MAELRSIPSCRLGALLLAAALAWLAPATARAGDEQELEIARARVDAGQYDEAATRFAKLLDPAAPTCPPGPDITTDGCRLLDPVVIQKARAYYAIALVALGQREQASKQLELVLKDNPQFTPSPAIYPQTVIEIFYEVRGRLAEELAAQARAKADAERAKQEGERRRAEARRRYLTELERLASEEVRIEERSRLVASIPFGVGQVQNEDVGLGVFFAVTEGGLGVTAITLALLYEDLAAKGRAAIRTPASGGEVCDATCRDDLLAQVDALQTANHVTMGLFAVAVVAGIVEAHIAFEPATPVVQRRKLPQRPPDLLPNVGITGVPGAPDAVGAGVRVRF